MKLRTWHMEATAQALLYLGAIYGQFGTLWRGELLLAAGLWLLGRVGSRADRQREQYDRTGVATVMAQHAVECAAGTKVDLRLASVAFGLWGLTIGSWLTLADVAWTLLYPVWRRWYRGWDPTGWQDAVLDALFRGGSCWSLELLDRVRGGAVQGGRSLSLRLLYPLMRDMERGGLVRSWDGEPLPDRGNRHYALTREGSRMAATAYRARQQASGRVVRVWPCPECCHDSIVGLDCGACGKANPFAGSRWPCLNCRRDLVLVGERCSNCGT